MVNLSMNSGLAVSPAAVSHNNLFPHTTTLQRTTWETIQTQI